MFVDTHAHLFKEYYDNIDEIINNANNKNIKYIINSGVDRKTNEEVLSYLHNKNLYATLGIHPEAVNQYTLDDLKHVAENTINPGVVAIGEIGLDYHYENTDKNKQIELFKIQLKIAQDYDLPVVIHSRDATQDTIDILKEYNVKGVIHSFSGSLEVANIYIKMGYLLGINGVVTFKNSNLKETLKQIELNNIILETDSPYLTPHPFRGKRNEPMYIDDIATFICEIKNKSKKELAEITNNNIKRIFKKIYF